MTTLSPVTYVVNSNDKRGHFSEHFNPKKYQSLQLLVENFFPKVPPYPSLAMTQPDNSKLKIKLTNVNVQFVQHIFKHMQLLCTKDKYLKKINIASTVNCTNKPNSKLDKKQQGTTLKEVADYLWITFQKKDIDKTKTKEQIIQLTVSKPTLEYKRNELEILQYNKWSEAWIALFKSILSPCPKIVKQLTEGISWYHQHTLENPEVIRDIINTGSRFTILGHHTLASDDIATNIHAYYKLTGRKLLGISDRNLYLLIDKLPKWLGEPLRFFLQGLGAIKFKAENGQGYAELKGHVEMGFSHIVYPGGMKQGNDAEAIGKNRVSWGRSTGSFRLFIESWANGYDQKVVFMTTPKANQAIQFINWKPLNAITNLCVEHFRLPFSFTMGGVLAPLGLVAFGITKFFGFSWPIQLGAGLLFTSFPGGLISACLPRPTPYTTHFHVHNMSDFLKGIESYSLTQGENLLENKEILSETRSDNLKEKISSSNYHGLAMINEAAGYIPSRLEFEWNEKGNKLYAEKYYTMKSNGYFGAGFNKKKFDSTTSLYETITKQIIKNMQDIMNEHIKEDLKKDEQNANILFKSVIWMLVSLQFIYFLYQFKDQLLNRSDSRFQ